uniref:Secreted protein n=1 Tax=Mesocestoides corti TaxID=53468 RepID=A0A5K3G1J2_MESCO
MRSHADRTFSSLSMRILATFSARLVASGVRGQALETSN